jgi:hypothetical protein
LRQYCIARRAIKKYLWPELYRRFAITLFCSEAQLIATLAIVCRPLTVPLQPWITLSLSGPIDSRRTRTALSVRRQYLNAQRLDKLSSEVRSEARQVATDLIQELKDRFPPTDMLDALEIVYPQFWSKKPVVDSKDLWRKVAQLEKFYCKEKQLTDGRRVAKMLSTDALKSQLGHFRSAMAAASPSFMQRHAAACKAAQQDKKLTAPGAAVSEFWKDLASKAAITSMFPEYMKLVEIAMVMVGGSVQDERLFSTLTFVKNKLRSSLGEAHLNDCLFLYSTRDEFDDGSFPYARAYELWRAARPRRGEGLMEDVE